MPIKILADGVVSKIAAGEVIERPASVVKELVENALDAKATSISIEVNGGGRKLLRVTDNGSGIPAAELELAFHRHATSKIGNLTDLETSLSLGFRGEALPSIAAVADVELVSRVGTEMAGSYVKLRDGVIIERGSHGHPQGTTTKVENLFERVPARLKFLKSLATENSHIASIVSHYALAFPEIRFILSIDGRNTLQTPGNGKLEDSLFQIYGVDVARNMLALEPNTEEAEVGVPRIEGMLGTPAISRSSRDHLSFFINRRWIKNRMLAWAVEQAYQGFLMTGKHPMAIVNISIPPSEIDVNVHPAKTEIKFHSEQGVFHIIQKAVRRTLTAQNPVPRIEERRAAYHSYPLPSNSHWPLAESNTKLGSYGPAPRQTTLSSLPALRVLGQLSASYIIAEGPDGLYLIDQHAAHERILFEQVKDQRSRQNIERQALLHPVPLECTPQQREVLEKRLENLATFGFSVERFGGKTYLVRAIPAFLAEKDWRAVLKDILDSDPRQNSRDEQLAISIACHSAIKAGQTLDDSEMRAIIRQLEKAAVPGSCPHGRPTMIHLSLKQLGKEFGRS